MFVSDVMEKFVNTCNVKLFESTCMFAKRGSLIVLTLATKVICFLSNYEVFHCFFNNFSIFYEFMEVQTIM